MRLTQAYGIVGDVPFLNVHLERDNRLYLDPSRIRQAVTTDPRANAAHGLLLGFFTEVVRCCLSTADGDKATGLALLQHMHEPNETRLGMSASRVAGHGFGAELGEILWRALRDRETVRVRSLTRLEDLRLFIVGVGNDLMSDLTTRIVFEVLVDFTRLMMVEYPSLAHAVSTKTIDLWDPATLTWQARDVELPYVAAHQLLLVSKRWVHWRTLMGPEAFYNRYATQTIQDEQTTHTADGQRIAPSKKTIKGDHPDVRALNNAQAAAYMAHDRDLVGGYRHWVDQTSDPLSDGEIEDRL